MSARLSFTVHDLVHELDQYADQVLRRDYGVGFSQFHFMAVLSDIGPSDMSALAACMGVTRAAISKRTPAMVADGWVSTSSGTGRSVILQLTAKGADLVQAAGDQLEQDLTYTFAGLTVAGERVDPEILNTQLMALTMVFREKGIPE